MAVVRDKNEDDFHLEVARALSGCQLVISDNDGRNNNERLSAELNEFKDERNFLSHQGIAHCLDYEGSLFQTTAVEFQPRLVVIQNEAERLRTAIHEEANKFRAHLWFDEIKDPP